MIDPKGAYARRGGSGRLALALWPDCEPDDLLRLVRSLIEGGAGLFLEKQEARAAGFALCKSEWIFVEGTRGGPVGYLEGVYVRPDFRRKGVAKRLVASCEQWAREQHCAKICQRLRADERG